jgi:prophage regulatory protein
MIDTQSRLMTTTAPALVGQEKKGPLITKAAVLKQIPISTATMWREIAAGRFPKPIRVGARRVAFFQTEIDEWLAARIAERDAKAA